MSQDQSTEAKEDSCDFDFFEAGPNAVRAIDFDEEEDFGGKAIKEIFGESGTHGQVAQCQGGGGTDEIEGADKSAGSQFAFESFKKYP